MAYISLDEPLTRGSLFELFRLWAEGGGIGVPKATLKVPENRASLVRGELAASHLKGFAKIRDPQIVGLL